MPWLINTAQLEKFRKYQKNVVILDATFYVFEHDKNARQAFLDKHIIGARFFDIDTFCDPHSTLPHMLTQDETLISEKLGALGITNDHRIIFYDNSPYHSSCRALWMLKVFGHSLDHLYIFDGNLDSWEKQGGKVELAEPRITPKHYTVHYQRQFVRSLVQIKANLQQPHEQIIDMRSAVRYAGGAEPRPHMRVGHIPGSFSFPFVTMFEASGRLKPMDKVRSQLEGIGVDLRSPIVCTCGSAITAPILDFVLDLLGVSQPHAVYDGSWAEWGATQLYEGETSLQERPVQTSTEVSGNIQEFPLKRVS
ncbi:MAG: hypothetical protein A3E83_08805 [Gammaproteobacteria bacterium RIFCSPHIGHO2_12_FULL_41_20]|nr:MAG: hypothetical protein A3E83_08805 [Gammaproteobacteria bacterium RIFCSPHIGHO2_12_FULL_41_20]